MHRVNAKFVSRLLAEHQKGNCIEISQELLANANGSEHILKSIVIGDEVWVYENDVQTKMQSLQWIGNGSP
jgi:hypothetical protein